MCESLAHLVTLFNEALDGAKYNRVEDALFTLLWDSDHQVRTTAVVVLLAAVSDWVDGWGQLGPKLAGRFLKEIEQELPRFSMATTVSIDPSSKLGDQDQAAILASVLFQAFESLLPKFKKAMLWGSPFALEILSNPNLPSNLDYSTKEPELIKLIDTFLMENASKDKYWPELSWLLDTFIPKLLALILKTEVPPKAQISSPAIRGLLQMVLATASIFGSTFTSLFIKSKFWEEIFPKPSASSATASNASTMNPIQKKEETKRREKLVPIYYAGVLTTLPSKDLQDSLKDFIVSLSQNDKGWSRDQLPILSSSLTLL